MLLRAAVWLFVVIVIFFEVRFTRSSKVEQYLCHRGTVCQYCSGIRYLHDRTIAQLRNCTIVVGAVLVPATVAATCTAASCCYCRRHCFCHRHRFVVSGVSCVCITMIVMFSLSFLLLSCGLFSVLVCLCVVLSCRAT